MNITIQKTTNKWKYNLTLKYKYKIKLYITFFMKGASDIDRFILIYSAM